MPLVDIPYEVKELESAEGATKRLERCQQARVAEGSERQEDTGKPKRSRADADDPAMGESAEIAEQGKLVKAEADKC